MKSNKEISEAKSKFRALLTESNEEEGVHHDAYMLMAGFLSEIERVQLIIGVNRKELAEKIGTSPSYLTQVFRGDKPLNFYTLAKIQRALKIRFNTTISFDKSAEEIAVIPIQASNKSKKKSSSGTKNNGNARKKLERK